MLKWVVAIVIMLGWPLGLAAQTSDPVVLSPQVQAAVQALPAQTVRRLRTAPDRFLQEAGRLIYGYGRDGAIDSAGLAQYVLLQRASVRARNLRQFLDADLDNDGTVSEAEISVRADTLASAARGRLRFAHGLADIDRDGSVSWQEMRDLAQAAAMEGLSAQDEAVLLGFIGFDVDKDGAVSMTEVQAMMTLFQPEL